MRAPKNDSEIYPEAYGGENMGGVIMACEYGLNTTFWRRNVVVIFLACAKKVDSQPEVDADAASPVEPVAHRGCKKYSWTVGKIDTEACLGKRGEPTYAEIAAHMGKHGYDELRMFWVDLEGESSTHKQMWIELIAV